MNIAVTYDNGQIFQHFGHTEEFKLYEIDGRDIVNTEVPATEGAGHGALGGWFRAPRRGCADLRWNRRRRSERSAQAGIQLFGGVSGSADDAVTALLNDSLYYNPNVRCSHHDHSGSHTCGDHGCGSHDH